jgi:hypothetical protein
VPIFYFQYELLVDRLANRPHADVELMQMSHYGQLEHLFALQLPAHSTADGRSCWLLLALVLEADTNVEQTYEYKAIWYKSNLLSGEVVDAGTIQCAVGRVCDDCDKRWWIIDRSSKHAYPEFV